MQNDTDVITTTAELIPAAPSTDADAETEQQLTDSITELWSVHVLALGTPYFAVSNNRGQIRIADVPPGRYRIEVWLERAESQEMSKLAREVTVSASTMSLGIIEVEESPLSIPPHNDKHGQPYENDRAPY